MKKLHSESIEFYDLLWHQKIKSKGQTTIPKKMNEISLIALIQSTINKFVIIIVF